MFRFFVFIFFFPFFQNIYASTVTFRLAEDAGTLDWNYGEVNPEIVFQAMEGLMEGDSEGKPVLAQAKSYQWMPSKLGLKFILRKDIFWSDGVRVCAKDFKLSLDRLLDKKFASPYAHYGSIIDSVTAENCEALTLKFNRPSPEALSLLSHFVFFPMRQENLEKERNQLVSVQELKTNGPYRILKWNKDSRMVLVRNPHYRRTKVKVETFEVVFLPEETTAKVMLDQGRIHWMKSPIHNQIHGLTKREEESLRVLNFNSYNQYYFGLSAKKAPELNNLSVRRALAEALNRSEISKVLGSNFSALEQWTPVGFVGKTRAEMGSDKAQSLKFSDPHQLVLRTYGKPQPKVVAEWAQEQWRKSLNLQIPIELQDSKTYWANIIHDPAPIFFSGITAPFSEPRAFLSEFLSTGSANWTGFRSSEFDQLVEQGKYQKAEQLLLDSGWVIPLYIRRESYLVRRGIHGLHVNPLGQIYLRGISK